MNNTQYIVYLHWCGFSHIELHSLYKLGKDFKTLFDTHSQENIGYYVNTQKRRKEIWQRFQKINTHTLDSIIYDLGVDTICYFDDTYPEQLKHIEHPPFILYVRGKIPENEMFGVVGSRKITHYGKRSIKMIVPELSKVFPIVSGGAMGCDTQAHKSCVEKSTPTVVVMGTGINECYPVGNAALFEKVIHTGGAVISSFRIDEPGNPYNFPVRNEIIVGLSKGILVVEAEEKSGSLITARLALEFGKDLFAIPGDIFSSFSGGTNSLIQKGEAKAVCSAQDILEEYLIHIVRSQKNNLIELLSSDEKRVYEHISSRADSIDTIMVSVGIEQTKLTGIISLLEIKNHIKKDLEGKYYIV